MQKKVAYALLGCIIHRELMEGITMGRIPSIIFGSVIISILFLTSCGSDVVTSNSAQGIASPSPSDGTIERSNDQTIEQSDYTGKIVIKFKDGTNVRLRPEGSDGLASPKLNSEGGPFVSRSRASTRHINELVTSYKSQVTSISRVTEMPEDEVDRWRAHWAEQNVQMHDWNLYYYLDVPDEEDAIALVNELNGLRVTSHESQVTIEYAGILPRFYLTSVTTADISDEQGYLKSASIGGLGVEDGWALLDSMFPGKEMRGQLSQVVDQEFDWNFDHEILPIDETSEYLIAPNMSWWNLWDQSYGKDIPGNINHGTAVVGIIAAQGDKIGKAIKGIVPDTKMNVGTINPGVGITGAVSGMYAEPYGQPGSILTIEVQQKGITTGPSGCSVGDGTISPIITGCVPLEAHKFLIDNIHDGANGGYVVIEGAGNGGVDLNDPNQAAPKEGMEYFSDFSNPANDSGAIMVGASLGANRKKASWSNCGSRVDVFAWGAGVVTAGYGDKFNPDGVDPNTQAGADNPKLYTGQFGGTSAATAMIAGVAALVQSYVRQLFEDAGFEPKTVYLDSKQMRTILKNSGQPAVYGQTPNDPNPNCNIGVQPDTAKAIDVATEFVKKNVLKIVPWSKEAMDGPKGINYDIDGDGRADLISFSRDHKWYIDLSATSPESQVTSLDGYGAWDLIIPSTFMGEGEGGGDSASSMLFPVVNDYNPNGQYTSKRLADLAIYDAVNGKWYIKYSTTPSPLAGEGGGGGTMEWDRVIDYSKDPLWKPYSRPVPGNYNGDGFLDIALQTPDGHWLIDYGGNGGMKVQLADGAWATLSSDGQWPDESKGQWTSVDENIQVLDLFGAFEKDVKYLTDAQLAEAPGWAWLADVMRIDPVGGWSDGIVFRVPDGLPNAAQILMADSPYNFEIVDGFPPIYGDNSVFLSIAKYSQNSLDIGLKDTSGQWKVILGGGNSWGKWGDPVFGDFEFNDIFGDINCRPIPADYDGDGKDDRAIQDGTTWKIVYSSDNSIREIKLSNALDPLPAYVYAGGIKYQDTVDLYNYYKNQIDCSHGKVCTIFTATPPIGPYFPQCVKYWSQNPAYCWDK